MAGAKTIHVASRAPSFWRAGIKFTRAGVDMDATQLTAEQLDAIRAEPALIVSETTPAKSGRSGGTDPSGKDAGGGATPQAPKKEDPAGNTTQPGAGKSVAKAPAKAAAKKAAR